MSRVWPVNTLFHTWDRCLFILADSRLRISFEKKSRQIQAENSDFILNPVRSSFHISFIFLYYLSCGCSQANSKAPLDPPGDLVDTNFEKVKYVAKGTRLIFSFVFVCYFSYCHLL